ncbi:hypothetical protein KTO58_11935 [Chitinophaga pendula]|uniref:hypothetical protein n=1 Tax=Chitinophaga pendula TaxID=2849666 RepID=UPI001CED2A9B|nr:hypothetical protein [Chitinophaga pendula]UCJ09872.1 hypothetical protein KTO58_11935 [Chitinophaga pendula]
MKKAIPVLLIVIVGIGIWLFGKSKNSTPLPKQESSAEQYNFDIVIDTLIPNDVVPNATPEQLVSFAWNQFFAVNWQSTYTPQNPRRGYADPNWSYTTETNPYPLNPLVWETYAHRIEFRPYNDTILRFDKVPIYKYKPQIMKDPNTDITLLNNLDENNEIGSCNLYANVNVAGTTQQVLYQAKVNRDEYQYIANTFKNSTARNRAAANTSKAISLDSAYYKGAKNSCNCPPSYNLICLPCGGAINPSTKKPFTGAMEVKTAWRESQNPEEDKKRYFTRTVITYEKRNQQLYAMNKTYLLIGMHIIHKTSNYPDFIFTTFEHVDVEKTHMGYIELNGKITPGTQPDTFRRRHPIPAVVDSSTAYAHRLLNKTNPTSIWQNYRLVGVQSQPSNDSTAFSFFLANYVIESDKNLSDFRGSSLINPFDGGVNVLLQNGQKTAQGYRVVSQGGCQGCHGATQIINGTDLSFLLVPDSSFFLAPDPYNYADSGSTSKLDRYKALFTRMRTELQTIKKSKNK